MAILKIHEKLEATGAHDCTLTLPFELRQKSRFKTQLDDGLTVGLVLPRGSVLRSGERLKAADGTIILVQAASEKVSYVACADAYLLARACYHLGNRHVPLQIGVGWLQYLHDHVLDEMLIGLGLVPQCIDAAFEPEAGAYDGHHGY